MKKILTITIFIISFSFVQSQNLKKSDSISFSKFTEARFNSSFFNTDFKKTDSDSFSIKKDFENPKTFDLVLESNKNSRFSTDYFNLYCAPLTNGIYRDYKGSDVFLGTVFDNFVNNIIVKKLLKKD